MHYGQILIIIIFTPNNCIDSSCDTFAIISSPSVASGNFITISPLSVQYLDITLIKINTGHLFTGFYGGPGNPFNPIPGGLSNDYSGSISLYRNTTQVYNSPISLMSGFSILFSTGLITGITSLKIFPEIKQSSSHNGLPLSEVEIY